MLSYLFIFAAEVAEKTIYVEHTPDPYWLPRLAIPGIIAGAFTIIGIYLGRRWSQKDRRNERQLYEQQEKLDCVINLQEHITSFLGCWLTIIRQPVDDESTRGTLIIERGKAVSGVRNSMLKASWIEDATFVATLESIVRGMEDLEAHYMTSKDDLEKRLHDLCNLVSTLTKQVREPRSVKDV